jgi:hypothetical protein
LVDAAPVGEPIERGVQIVEPHALAEQALDWETPPLVEREMLDPAGAWGAALPVRWPLYIVSICLKYFSRLMG